MSTRGDRRVRAGNATNEFLPTGGGAVPAIRASIVISLALLGLQPSSVVCKPVTGQERRLLVLMLLIPFAHGMEHA